MNKASGVNGIPAKLFQTTKDDAVKVWDSIFQQIWKTQQRSNCQHPLDHRKIKEFQKKVYYFFIDYSNASDCVDLRKLWKILKEKGAAALEAAFHPTIWGWGPSLQTSVVDSAQVSFLSVYARATDIISEELF